MILTTYKYIVNGYYKLSILIKKNDDFNNNLTPFVVSFSFNYFSLTKLFCGMCFCMSNRFWPMNMLKIKV